MRQILIALACLIVFARLSAAGREVAITIDDLPWGGDGSPRTFDAVRERTERLLRPFRDQRIPVTGFVNAGSAVRLDQNELRRVLELWLDSGADLGNHSYLHPDINSVPLADYTADITRGEPLIRDLLAARRQTLRYYRHPFLRTGSTPELKAGLQAFLDRQGYRVAPVTIDNADYIYAALYTNPVHRARIAREYVPYMESVVGYFERRSVEVLGREIPQILLIHANALNADLMPDLLAMFRRRGYSFVSLDDALADEAYRSPDPYVGFRGLSWLHRWSKTQGLPPVAEPDPPQWVLDAFSSRR